MNNKILKRAQSRILLLWISTLIFRLLPAQNHSVSGYGLPYINSLRDYRNSLFKHPEKRMESLKQIAGIILDLRYASTNNFTHTRLYHGQIKTSYLRKPVFNALDSVSRELQKQGLELVIFDAYRPYSVTEKLWEKVKDERYAANPSKGSGHNRGVAVDLTLADSKTHRQLAMPTGFDNFSDTAHQDFAQLDSDRITHRELLKKTMEKYGFIALPTEWWHFSWPHPELYEVLDLEFSRLASDQ